MKRYAICALAAILYFQSPVFAEITFRGNSFPVITEKPDASTGLNAVYVVRGTGGVSISYTAASPAARPTWSIYGTRGGGYAEPIQNVIYNGAVSTLENITGDCGYIIEDGGSRTYFWITDYSLHEFSIDNLQVGPDSGCSSVSLDFTGNAAPIYYTTINGRQMELPRDIKLTYSTMEFDMGSKSYNYTEPEKTLGHIAGSILVDAPLTDTGFRLTGDRFLQQWNEEKEVETPVYKAIAVQAYAEAEQTVRENDNEQSAGTSGSLGGSAPAEIEFTAWTTDAAVFKEWQISHDQEFDIIDLRDNNLVFNHTFREDGNFYVRFAAANADGSCESYSQTFDVSIGESDLKCPNAFSPGNADGVNDIWKVSYKSIISFECHIFNRWGQQVCSFSNPADGWDGKYKGKLAPSGVYYYVIKAKGADGRNYNLKGDINIINHDRSQTGTGGHD